MTKDMARAEAPGSRLSDRAASVSAVPASIPRAAAFKARYHGAGLIKAKRTGAEQKHARKLRLLLVEDQQGRCYFCRRLMTSAASTKLRSTDATVEHLIPRALGGALCPENCVAACHACNRHRNCMAPGRFRWRHVRYQVAALLRRISGWADERAQAIEARRAATGTGAVHERAVPKECAPDTSRLALGREDQSNG